MNCYFFYDVLAVLARPRTCYALVGNHTGAAGIMVPKCVLAVLACPSGRIFEAFCKALKNKGLMRCVLAVLDVLAVLRPIGLGTAYLLRPIYPSRGYNGKVLGHARTPGNGGTP